MYSASKVATRYVCQTYARLHNIDLIWTLITSIYGSGRNDNNLISYAIQSLLKGEKPSTNPMATLFAWTGALRKSGEITGNAELQHFAERLEQASIDTISSGTMTGDMALLYDGEAKVTDSEGFLKTIAERLQKG